MATLKMTIKPKVDIVSLMTQAAKEMRSAPVAMGFWMAANCLERIAKPRDQLN